MIIYFQYELIVYVSFIIDADRDYARKHWVMHVVFDFVKSYIHCVIYVVNNGIKKI